MRRIIIVWTILLPIISFGQNFEGMLTYHMDLEIHPILNKTGMTKEMLIDVMKRDGSWADEITISYKGGCYYSEMTNEKTTYSIYRNDSNKVFTYTENGSILTVDASIDVESKSTNKLPVVSLRDTLVEVYNKTCKVVRIEWISGYYDYYFNSDFLKMSPDLYSNYTLDGWYFFLKISNSLPLRIVKYTKGMTVIKSLKSAETKVINSALFNVPDGASLLPLQQK